VGCDKVAVLIVILALAAIVTIYFLRKPRVKSVSRRPIGSTTSTDDTAHRVHRSTAPRIQPVSPTTSQAPPKELAAFRFFGSDCLLAEQRDALREDLRQLPRPPLSLYKLVSPELLDSATSGEISDLIMSEALIAAQVLARVNSPFYGLRRPVVSIGQAITFLGLNSVRGICLQYMLEASFTSNSPERKKVFDMVSSASALAGELCFKLAHHLELPAQGSLVTQVVLSFLGHLATASLLPLDCILWSPTNGLLERASAEQLRLGLSATEIGSMLMQQWGLPTSLIAEVGEIDRMLVTPVDQIEPDRSARLAVCFLCARLGERLALGSLSDLAAFDLSTDSSMEFFYLRGHLDSPRLARLAEFLQSKELVKSVRQMQLALLVRDQGVAPML
jgi:HD-like signal output (HDOD) protein